MRTFTVLTARAAPLIRSNIDTEMIVSIDRSLRFAPGSLGPFCFEAWRKRPDGTDAADFPLNEPRYRGAQILVTGDNFGGGSSREAAVWSLLDYGMRCIIAPSFADMFANHCVLNGVLPLRLSPATVQRIAAQLAGPDGGEMTVDLIRQTLALPAGEIMPITVDPQTRDQLTLGLDVIGLTLRLRTQILAHQAKEAAEQPWMTPQDHTTPRE